MEEERAHTGVMLQHQLVPWHHMQRLVIPREAEGRHPPLVGLLPLHLEVLLPERLPACLQHPQTRVSRTYHGIPHTEDLAPNLMRRFRVNS